MEYYDEISKVESSVDGDAAMPAPADVAVKVLHLSDLSIELGTALSNMEGRCWTVETIQ